MSNKVWNYKLRGLGGVIYNFSGILLSRILNFFFFTINKGNFQKLGKGTKIYRGLVYRYPGNIQIGKNCIINKNVTMGSELNDSLLKISNNVSIAQNVKLDFTGGLIIKDNVTISENVSVFTHDHGFNPRSTPEKKELIIEENVWIGSNAIILQNVSIIKKNAIIAAGAVVTKNVEKDIVVGGNPAKLIKKIN